MLEKDLISISEHVEQMLQAHREALLNQEELSALTMRQLYYLKRIGRLNSPTLSELAHLFKITKPSVTSLINRLTSMGFLEKKQSSEDMRVFTVKLTARGERLTRVDEEALMEFGSHVRSSLNERELEEMEFLLAKLLAVL
ncbi:MAG: MarR family transcriptional regulator [Anaerolineae bacterium]|nr:MarR family transcriptional regulator [Anaerolineae bacterium]